MQIDASKILGMNDNIVLPSEIPSSRILSSKVQNPFVTIAIPVYNRLSTLKKCLSAALSQATKLPYDVIVVEDNPASGTPVEQYLSSLNEPRLSYWKNSRNLGLTANFNRTVFLGRGRYVVLVHDDDYLFPNYIDEMIRVVSIHPDADIICPSAVKWKEYAGEPEPSLPTSRKRYTLWRPSFYGEAFFRQFMPTGVTFRRISFLESGGFDPDSGPSTDLYYIVRASGHMVYYKYDKPLYVYRWSEHESMKLSTRMDFVRFGLPLRDLILRRLHVAGILRKYVLEYYSRKSVDDMYRSLSSLVSGEREAAMKDISEFASVLPMPRRKAGYTIGKQAYKALSRFFSIKRYLYPRV